MYIIVRIYIYAPVIHLYNDIFYWTFISEGRTMKSHRVVEKTSQSVATIQRIKPWRVIILGPKDRFM